MRRILIFGLCLATSLIVVVTASASTLSIPVGIGGMPYYGGEYVGPISANLNGSPITGGITCLDILSTTYVPNSGFYVNVGTLSPVDLSHARFGSDATALFKYQEAGWLLGQMAKNPNDIGAIQFAIWRIFTPGASSGTGNAREEYWFNLAAHTNFALYDFSFVRIYTPTDTNQEFMSGAAELKIGAAANPIPSTVWLLGSGVIALLAFRKRFSA